MKAFTARDVDLSLRSDRVYRTDVIDSLITRRSTTSGRRLIRRPRQQGRSAGDGLPLRLARVKQQECKASQERIRDVRAHAATSPTVIIAHSMGGLVTKVWAARHAKEPCANGKEPVVAQIVFVATPHLGSPKAIKAIAQGYNILFDELAPDTTNGNTRSKPSTRPVCPSRAYTSCCRSVLVNTASSRSRTAQRSR